MAEELFVVRLYDSFDNQWCDITVALPRAQADRVWKAKTANGTRQTKYEDGDYFEIFPAGSVMLFSNGFGERTMEPEAMTGLDPEMAAAIQRHTAKKNEERARENAESNARWREREERKAAGSKALRAAIRLPNMVADILDAGPISDLNAAATLSQAYNQLADVRRFLDSLPRPEGWVEPE